MAATLFLMFGLGLTGLVGMVALQMRMLTARALFLAAQDRFADAAQGDLTFGVKASPLALDAGGQAGIVQVWLRETYPVAVKHLRLARRATWIAPLLMLAVVVVWRFGLGGGV